MPVAFVVDKLKVPLLSSFKLNSLVLSFPFLSKTRIISPSMFFPVITVFWELNNVKLLVHINEPVWPSFKLKSILVTLTGIATGIPCDIAKFKSDIEPLEVVS